MSYSFRDQHQRGREAEILIYELFQPTFNVIPAGKDLQDVGVDFLFTDRTNNQTWKVELKTDSRAYTTGNAFIETIAVDRENKMGWAYTSTADWLLYFIPQDRRIYRIAMEVLRAELPGWELRYPKREIPNKGAGGNYCTHGLLVPLAELYRIAQEVIEG
jgi:hypothetical protein